MKVGATNRASKLDSTNSCSREEVRGHHAEKFTGRNNLGSFPKAREVPHVSGDEIVCSGSIRAFHKDVVVGINSNPELARRGNELSAVLYELQKLLPKGFTDLQLRPH